MHTHIIQLLKNGGWQVTLHDVGVDRAELVLAVKVSDAIDLWYLARDCVRNHLEMGAVFLTANNIVYFPLFVADADDYKAVMA